MDKKLKNKIIVMTGATSGLGSAAAKKFVEEGATLIVFYRNKEKLIALKEELGENGELIGLLCDLSSSASLKKSCDEVKNRYNNIDIIINNAGVWSFDFKESEDGIEKTFQINVLSPYIIIHELKDLLLKSDSPKVITTASALYQGGINFQDIEYRSNYSGYKAYRQSKLAVILLMRFFAKKEPEILYVSQHPGLVNTGLVRGGNWFAKLFFKLFGKSPEKGAETLVYLVETPTKQLKSGAFYANSHVKKTTTKESNDLELAEKLEKEIKSFIESKFDYIGLE